MESSISNRGVSYYHLEHLLNEGDWQQADDETYSVMCQVMRKSRSNGLSIQDIAQFPCYDLQKIDELWMKWSSGHFGFSVQKRLFEEVGRNGERLARRIGWISNDLWIAYSDVTWKNSAPEGHLPIGGRGGLFASIGDLTQGKGESGVEDTAKEILVSGARDLFHQGGLNRFWKRLNDDIRLKNGFSKAWIYPRITLLARMDKCGMKGRKRNSSDRGIA